MFSRVRRSSRRRFRRMLSRRCGGLVCKAAATPSLARAVWSCAAAARERLAAPTPLKRRASLNTASIKRLLAPRTIALFGSAWADAVDAASKKIGFSGEVWRLHPTRPSTGGIKYFRSVDELPAAPDSSFVAAPAHEVPKIAADLASRDAGGFV